MNEANRSSGAVASGGTRGTLMDLTRIEPSNGAKYSPNLHGWLTNPRKKHRRMTSRVYRDRDGTLWIGMLDGKNLVGQKLMSVLVAGAQADSACWVNLKGLAEVENFWRDYEQDGRCAIDREHKGHFIGDESRWRVSGSERGCMWCGRHRQILRRWAEVVVREQWEAAPEGMMQTGSWYSI